MTRPGKRLQITIKHHHVQWVNPLLAWSFSIAMLNIVKLPEGILLSLLRIEDHHNPLVESLSINQLE